MVSCPCSSASAVLTDLSLQCLDVTVCVVRSADCCGVSHRETGPDRSFCARCRCGFDVWYPCSMPLLYSLPLLLQCLDVTVCVVRSADCCGVSHRGIGPDRSFCARCRCGNTLRVPLLYAARGHWFPYWADCSYSGTGPTRVLSSHYALTGRLLTGSLRLFFLCSSGLGLGLRTPVRPLLVTTAVPATLFLQQNWPGTCAVQRLIMQRRDSINTLHAARSFRGHAHTHAASGASIDAVNRAVLILEQFLVKETCFSIARSNVSTNLCYALYSLFSHAAPLRLRTGFIH